MNGQISYLRHSPEDKYREADVLKMYLKEINGIALLSRDEERECLKKAKAGDIIAREKIIKANLRFVVSVAKKFRGSELPLEDLIDEGNIGLMMAIERYDLLKKCHFITYAVWWIRQSILNAIEEKSRIIRLPSNIGSALSKLEKANESRGNFRSFYSDRFLREAALELHTTETHIKHLIKISHVSTSFDELSDSEKCASNMRNCLRTDDSELLDEKISAIEYQGKIKKFKKSKKKIKSGT